MKVRIAVGVAALVVAVLVWWFGLGGAESLGSSEQRQEQGSSSSSSSSLAGSSADHGADGEQARARRDAGTDAAEAPSTTSPTTPETDPERSAADAYRARIQEALQDRIAAAGAEDRDFTGRLDPQYIRDAVQEIRPLLGECYEMAVQAAQEAGDDVPEGQLVTEFTFVGAPGEGGIVESSSIDENSEVYHPVLDECFRETLYTLELPAPEEGGRILVRYPFQLRNTPDEESAPAP